MAEDLLGSGVERDRLRRQVGPELSDPGSL